MALLWPERGARPAKMAKVAKGAGAGEARVVKEAAGAGEAKREAFEFYRNINELFEAVDRMCKHKVASFINIDDNSNLKLHDDLCLFEDW